MENTKDQYIGTEIHSARSVNPDGETVTLDGETVVWTGKKANSKKRLPFGDKGAIIYIKGTTAPQGGLTSYKDCKDHPFARQSFGVVLLCKIT